MGEYRAKPLEPTPFAPSPEHPIPIEYYYFGNDYTYHRILSCVRHPRARFTSKNPFARSVFPMDQSEQTRACDCPINHLTVIGDEKHPGNP